MGTRCVVCYPQIDASWARRRATLILRVDTCEGTMNLLPRWMRSDATQRGQRTAEPDPGDMGTAFGLDASLGPAEEEPLAQSSTPPDNSFWQQRLDRRPQR
jgi:hypothetical protein